MRCPRIAELPTPPSQKSGWPWTQESSQLPDKMPDDGDWPKISIVTPSMNQGEYLEETIRSVLLQGYPNLEYIIIDGGSTDQSIEILKKYEKWLTYWVSEKDQGQAHAINKGLKKATGTIIGWINSDDYYQKDVFGYIAKELITNSRKNIITGGYIWLEENANKMQINAKQTTWYNLISHPKLWRTNEHGMPCQPSVFWKSELIEDVGLLDEELIFALDYEYWLRAIKSGYKFKTTNRILSVYRVHDSSKTYSGFESFVPEWTKVSKRYFKMMSLKEKANYLIWKKKIELLKIYKDKRQKLA